MTKNIQTIIHASFIQPEWENPWTNEIFLQKEAHPYNNIYEQLTTTCYSPNSSSRVLDNEGKIRKIINNYEYISFNFSHSILNYLKKNNKNIYNKIITADAKSINNHNGHGNAIATTYHDSILPLLSFEDKKTEIIWGLKDFAHHFNRESEGIWLNELATDYKTIDLLIEIGVRFIVLSPDQVIAYKDTAKSDWIDIDKSNFLPNKVFTIKRAHGEIAAFIYDKEIVTGISFQHLLRNSDNLAGNIINSPLLINDDNVMVIASDGGVYGYYEPFGDMCLASLIENYYDNKTIQLINFGEYLVKHPPQTEIALSLGEDGLGTSWSCPHGVGKWYKDCGCKIEGKENYNQNWKEPLKKSFDFLREKLEDIYISNAKECVIAPEEIRNKYIDIVNNRDTFDYESFFAKYALENPDLIDISHLLSLLEMQKNILSAFSSTAWSYEDISNIHTIQSLKFAYNALFYVEDSATRENIKMQFEQKLEKVLSNNQKFKNAKYIAEKIIYPEIIGNYNIPNNIVALLINNEQIKKQQFSFFENYDFEEYDISTILENILYKGFIQVKNKITQAQYSYYFLFYINNTKGEFENYISVKENSETFNKISTAVLNNNPHIISDKSIKIFSLKNLPYQIKEYIINYNFRKNNRELLTNSLSLLKPVLNLLESYKSTNVQPMYLVKSISTTSIEAYFQNLFYKLKTFPDKELYINLIRIFDLINYFNLNVNLRAIKKTISELINNNILIINSNPVEDKNENICEQIIILIQFTDRVSLKIEKSNAENIIYEILQIYAPVLIDKIKNAQNSIEKKRNIDRLKQIVRLAITFNINVDNIKQLFANKLRNNDTSSKFL